MTRQVITVTEDTPLEEAARIMVDSKIGGLPVVRDGQLAGIITETDLFKIFVALLGGRSKGVRVTAYIPESRGRWPRSPMPSLARAAISWPLASPGCIREAVAGHGQGRRRAQRQARRGDQARGGRNRGRARIAARRLTIRRNPVD